MNNVIKAALVATTALVAAPAMATNFDAEGFSEHLGKWGVDASSLDFSGVESAFTVDAEYGDFLEAEAQFDDASTMAETLLALQAVKEANDAWTDGNKVTTNSLTFATELDKLVNAAVDTVAADIVTDMNTYLTQIGTATGGVITDLVDGKVDDDQEKEDRAALGLDLLIFVAGGDGTNVLQKAQGSKVGYRASDFAAQLGISDTDMDDADTIAAEAWDNDNHSIKHSVFKNEADFSVTKSGTEYTASLSIVDTDGTLDVFSDESGSAIKMNDLSQETVTVDGTTYNNFNKSIVVDGTQDYVFLSDWIE